MSSLSLGGATFTSHLSPRPLSLRPQWLRTLCGLPVSPDHPQTLQEGELALLVEPRRHHKPRLIKLDSSKHTETSIGRLHHSEAVGREVGVQAHTTLGGRVTVRKPSLEEYTLLMSRGATPSYCSVIYTALCMLDIGSGSKVIEAGTGSGAMTLHLSRIVGAGGRVLSFEVNPAHQEIARRNVASWTRSWDLTHSHQRKWPDNITFHTASVQEACNYLEDPPINGVFLDLPRVPSVLSGVVDLLQPCGVAVIFLTSITQVVEIDALIRSTKLPLQTDQIVGVSLKHWTVKPSRAKRLITPANERVNSPEWGSHDDRAEEEGSASGSSEVTGAPTLGYICRPSHRQPPHCGFLMKTRRLLHSDTVN